MRKFVDDTEGNINPVAVFIICLSLAGFLVLLFGHVIEPFMNLSHSFDDTVAQDISEPRTVVNSFMSMVWPKGVLIVVLFASGVGMLVEYQKWKYHVQGR